MSIPVVVSAEHNLLSDKERDLRHVIVKAVASGLTHEERKMYVLLNSFELSIPRPVIRNGRRRPDASYRYAERRHPVS